MFKRRYVRGGGFRRRFRRKASWAFADSRAASVTDGVGNTLTSVWILPPARALFIMNTDRTNSVLFMGCHLWMDFWWTTTATGTALPDVDFWMIKSAYDDSGNAIFAEKPWTSPTTPNSISSWEDSTEEDGTISFLWEHHIKGMTPPNARILQESSGGDYHGNQLTGFTGTVDAASLVCRKFMTQQEWQPDVRVKTRRRLQKGEGILLVMSSPLIASGVHANLDVRLRTLVARGR